VVQVDRLKITVKLPKVSDGYFLSIIAKMMAMIKPRTFTSKLANAMTTIISSADKSAPPFC
jgi:hypothetical protein